MEANDSPVASISQNGHFGHFPDSNAECLLTLGANMQGVVRLMWGGDERS